MTWKNDAPCVGRVDLFFPEEETAETVSPAQRVCESCAYRWSCVDASLNEEYGVWGGLAVWQRRSYRLHLTRNFRKIEPLVTKAVNSLVKNSDGSLRWLL